MWHTDFNRRLIIMNWTREKSEKAKKQLLKKLCIFFYYFATPIPRLNIIHNLDLGPGGSLINLQIRVSDGFDFHIHLIVGGII